MINSNKAQREELIADADSEVGGRIRSEDIGGIIQPAGVSVEQKGAVSMDITYLDRGYFFVNYEGENRKVLLTIENGTTDPDSPPVYYYKVGGGWQGFALPYGSGAYTVTVLAGDGNSSVYSEHEVFDLNAAFGDEAEPFRYRTVEAYYEEDYPLVEMAFDLVQDAEKRKKEALTDAEKTDLIVGWVYDKIKDDAAFEAQIKSGAARGYVPSPYATFETQKGVCNDRASLAASMLKCLGIPIKIIHGHVTLLYLDVPEQGYHAWIEAYLDGEWVRYDPTNSGERIITDIIEGRIEYLSVEAVF
jgi:hypothetical protein